MTYHPSREIHPLAPSAILMGISSMIMIPAFHALHHQVAGQSPVIYWAWSVVAAIAFGLFGFVMVVLITLGLLRREESRLNYLYDRVAAFLCVAGVTLWIGVISVLVLCRL